jgi:DNA-binding transcriptional MerR regulator
LDKLTSLLSDKRAADNADEPVYSIGAVARMLDVPTSTLRGWERRYALVAPGRSKGAHRLYSSNDVEQLLFIKTKLDTGASAADAHRLLARRRPDGRGRPGAEPVDDDFKPDGASVMLGGSPVPLHSHYPAFYATDEGRLRLALPFLRDGLRLGQTCFLSASGKVRVAYLDALIKLDEVDIESAMGNGKFVLVDSIGGSVDECIAFWERTFWKALEAGSTVIRVVGEMECEREVFSSEAEMMSYELAYNAVAHRFPAVTLCQYDVRAFNGEVILEALKAHPDTYERRVATFLS